MQSLAFLCSSIGKKYLMAITGLLLLGFVIAHLLGNLLIFAGPQALNAYAKKLMDLGGFLWGARLILLLSVAIHIVTAIQLSLENKKARAQSYQYKATLQTTFAARTMLVSGLMVLAFIIYHLLHFTFGVTHPEFSHLMDPLGRHDVYRMVVRGFQEPLIAIAYVVAMFLLCMHLAHGIASTFQSLGVTDEILIVKLQKFSRLFSFFLFLGYSSIPLSIWLGVIR